MLKITASAQKEMFKHCEKKYPHEACGYLAGRDGVATKAYPITNTQPSATSYEMDPVAQLVLQKQLRQLKMEELAIYHSHVATQAYPSRRDIQQATTVQDFFDGHYVLVTLEEEGHPSARVFKIRDGQVTEEELLEVPSE